MVWIVRLFFTKEVGYFSNRVRIVCEIMLNLYAVISNSSETKEILGDSWKSKKFLRSLMLNDNIVNNHNQKRLGTAFNLSNKMLTAFLFHWRLLIVHHIWNLSYSWKKMKRLQTGKDSPFLVSLYQIILKGYIDLSIFLCFRRGWLPFQDLYAQASNEHQVSTLISNNLWISIYYDTIFRVSSSIWWRSCRFI